jgi:hypothetical protein
MSNDFGKDLGLVHEAVIMGRKVGADKEFWSALAENEELFRWITEELKVYQRVKSFLPFCQKDGIDPMAGVKEDFSDIEQLLDGLSRYYPGNHSVPGKSVCMCHDYDHPTEKEKKKLQSLLHYGEADAYDAYEKRLKAIGLEVRQVKYLNECDTIEGYIAAIRFHIRVRRRAAELLHK